ncbi:MAG: sulfite exporter TauE/SafE family protein [Clostridia bacterium]|nr:sulfite exporter TauE/SafE family protein [Clostridia bacterium]
MTDHPYNEAKQDPVKGNRRRPRLKLLLTGAAAGFVNGFLGTGGGILLLFASLLSKKRRPGDTRDIFASTALVTMLLSAVSAVFYFWKGSVPVTKLPLYLLPALAGGAVGARLLDRLPTQWLERLFALLVLVAGAIMLFR